MKIFQDFFEHFKSKEQAPFHQRCHPPTDYYKIIHYGLIVPNLPAPLHYLNFFSLLGQPNIPVLKNESAIETSPLDTAVVLASVSARMVGQLHHYSMQQHCQFTQQHLQFLDREKISGNFPHFYLERIDDELSFKLQLKVDLQPSSLIHIPFGLADYWSVPCHCEGELQYQQQYFRVDQLGCFDFARSINFPYLPFAFFTHQVIQLNTEQQMILLHLRDQFNRVLQSRLIYKDLIHNKTQIFEDIKFQIKRVYPCIQTPTGHKMYLAREFSWVLDNEKIQINIEAQSRGDYKFGLAAGYVGSFCYQIQLNQQFYEGKSAYCSYIDCRPLNWQEYRQTEKDHFEASEKASFLVKK